MCRYQPCNDFSAIGYFDDLALFLHHTQYFADTLLKFVSFNRYDHDNLPVQNA